MEKKTKVKQKRRNFYFSLLVLAAFTMFALSAVYASNTTVYIGENKVPFTAESGFPFTDGQGRMQVPLRSTMESFGCTVTWNNEEQKASLTKDGTTVEVPLGKSYLYMNGTQKATDTVALIQNGRVYLPIRPVLEAFGATLTWKADQNALFISSSPATVSPAAESPATETPAEKLNVHFIDVGQADSIFIDNGDYEVLIDGGNNKDGKTVATYLKDYVDGPLELMIGTHPDADHIGGLDDVLKAFDVETVIDSGGKKDTKTYEEYWKAVTSEPSCQVLYDEDKTLDLGDGVSLKIIETGDTFKDVNDNSVVAQLTYGSVSLLLTGDMEKEAEAAVLSKLSPVTVLKSGHHGSATSSSEQMLSITKPKYVVISAGKDNTYYHPHGKVLKRYADIGATVYGTFRSGSIVMTTDGKTVSFNTKDPVQLSDAGDYKKAS